MLLEKERKQIVTFGKKLVNSNLTTGTGGNLSIFNRRKNLIAISASGIDYFDTTVDDVVVVDLNGKIHQSKLKPSSELNFHIALYRRRNDINSVVHTHSVYATTLACLEWELPAVHYLVGFAGKKVPVAPYATFGTQELADNISNTIKNYNAVLLANHGLIATGNNLLEAFTTAEEIELVARIYYQSKSIGNPVIISEEQMESVIKKFDTYRKGQNSKITAEVEKKSKYNYNTFIRKQAFTPSCNSTKRMGKGTPDRDR
ncbi:MAG: fuculose phosphate aldolase [Desulfobacteraceae bacterium 4572_19]|nr:MAG: fuculose phosphate aldolase [Desulfobacteraceae bacterium 4572_19]